MTPQTSQSDAFATIAALVVVMAAISGLSARFGVNYVVAIVCALIAMFGTWRLLAPTAASAEVASGEPQPAPLPGTPGGTAFAPVPETSALAGKPGADERVRAVGPTGTLGKQGVSSNADSTAAEAAADSQTSIDDIGWLPDARVNSLGGSGRLPDGAQALAIDPPDEWVSNVSGAYTLSRFDARAASHRGTDHGLLDELRQDDFVVARAGGNKYLIAVLANGVRTAENAHLGSYWACRLLARNIELHLRDGVPGIENMLDRTRADIQTAFGERFDADTKLRTIATRLVGLIVPVEGGPAAGFRVGDGEIFAHGPLGWSSVFGEAPPAEANMVFPRVSKAEVVSVDCTLGPILLAGDGVSRPLLENEAVAAAFSKACAEPPSEAAFDELVDFALDSARDDRTAVGIWFTAR